MTSREIVAVARSACKRAERRLSEARRSGKRTEQQAARAHWDNTLRDLQRVLRAVGQ